MQSDHDGHETAERLEEWYRPHFARLSPEESDALRCYQVSDRAYGLVNGVLRGGIDPRDLAPNELDLVSRLIADVSSGLAKSPLSKEVTVWRGIEDVEATFGPTSPDCSALIGVEKRLAGFASSTVSREVAEEFADALLGALLRIAVPAGITGAWLPSLGEVGFEDEGELLLESDLVFAVTGCEDFGGILLLDCEVKR